MPISCAVLMCHAPIVVPEVAGERASECSQTTLAMTSVADRICAHQPDVLVIISPHAQRHPRHWGVCVQNMLRGSFRRFGAPHVGVALPGAQAAATRLTRVAKELALELDPFEQAELDHGTLVPLQFVARAGFQGPTLLIAPPARQTREHDALGRAIARAAAEAGERWAVLASGDMSHRLIPGAPCGYDPSGATFDDKFRAHISRGALREACNIDPALREQAAEDVVDSVAVAAAAVGYRSDGHHTYSYEGPFGVGYLEAVLFDAGARAHDDESSHDNTSDGEIELGPPWPALLKAAREAIASRVTDSASPQLPILAPPWHAACGVFVTLRDLKGSLRGCVGHIEPQHDTLVQEVAACAIAAALRDTRFRPVTARELPHVRIEISLLSPPEPVSDLSLLNPKRYGVIVSSGTARGVLLPDIPGVTTVHEQLHIAASKAGLSNDVRDLRDLRNLPWSIERFEVLKGSETVPLTTTRHGDA